MKEEAVSLAQILECRDRRALRQHSALDEYGKTLLSLTLVIPGPIKNSANSRFLFQIAIQCIDSLLQSKGWPRIAHEIITEVTGPEALYVIDHPAEEVKRALLDIEDTHPLGRLWDMDVICPQQGNLSRTKLGHLPRPCLLCNEAAHVCSRSRAHPVTELQHAIEEKLDEYRRSL